MSIAAGLGFKFLDVENAVLMFVLGLAMGLVLANVGLIWLGSHVGD